MTIFWYSENKYLDIWVSEIWSWNIMNSDDIQANSFSSIHRSALKVNKIFQYCLKNSFWWYDNFFRYTLDKVPVQLIPGWLCLLHGHILPWIFVFSTREVCPEEQEIYVYTVGFCIQLTNHPVYSIHSIFHPWNRF